MQDRIKTFDKGHLNIKDDEVLQVKADSWETSGENLPIENHMQGIE